MGLKRFPPVPNEESLSFVQGVLVGVGVTVGVGVGVLVGVRVGVMVGVRVGVMVGTCVGVLVGVRVGVMTGGGQTMDLLAEKVVKL